MPDQPELADVPDEADEVDRRPDQLPDGETVSPKFLYSGDDELQDVPPGWTFPKA